MRTTGATDDQLLAACERNAERNGYTRGDSNILDLAYFGRGNRMTECAKCLVRPDQRIVEEKDLRELHNVALNFRERMVSIVLTDAINRAEGDLTQEQMDAISARTRERWYNTYPEFADACERVEALLE